MLIRISQPFPCDQLIIRILLKIVLFVSRCLLPSLYSLLSHLETAELTFVFISLSAVNFLTSLSMALLVHNVPFPIDHGVNNRLSFLIEIINNKTAMLKHSKNDKISSGNAHLP
jgi:hypothetical protein